MTSSYSDSSDDDNDIEIDPAHQGESIDISSGDSYFSSELSQSENDQRHSRKQSGYPKSGGDNLYGNAGQMPLGQFSFHKINQQLPLLNV